MVMPLLAFPHLNPVCPIDLLPEPLKGAALHAIAKKGVPPSVALTDAIAAAAAVVHCGYDCIAPDGETMPATINTCIVAPSATGKGRSFKLFFEHFLRTSKKRDSLISGKDTDGKDKPWRTPQVETMMNKLSFRMLMEELDGDGMSLTIQREEGTSFLETELFKKDTDALTQLWSGDPPLDHFVYQTQLIANDARCSLSFRIQPDPMYGFLRRDKRLTYKLGFWPRTIAGCHDPEKFPGNELYRPSSTAQPSPDAFHQRMTDLAQEINNRYRSGFTGRFGVPLDAHAKAFMLELGFRMKYWLTVYYPDIREAAGRAWENTLRVAVVLQVFCKANGEVSRSTVERAWAIVEWSLSQHRLIFVEAARPLPKSKEPKAAKPYKLSQYQQRLHADMQHMLDAIGARAPYYPYGQVPLSEVSMLTGFNKTRFMKTLGWLTTSCYVWVEGYDEYATVRTCPR